MTLSFYFSLLILFGGVLAGAALVLWGLKTFGSTARLLLAFSGSFLFSTTIFVWLPEVFSSDHGHASEWTGIEIGAWVMVGFLLQYLLDFATKGLEHGHVHMPSDHSLGAHHAQLPLGALLGLVLHSLLEGLPLAALDTHSRTAFVSAIALHNLPVSMVLVLWFTSLRLSLKKIALGVVLFALATPVGALLGQWIAPNEGGVHTVFIALVAGIFLHVSTTILFENQKDHRFNAEKLAVVMGGAALAWAVALSGSIPH